MSRKSKSLKLQAALKLQRSHLSQRERGEPLARALPERWGWRISRTSTTGTPTTLPIAGVAICVVAGLGVLTWNQVQIWHDSERLWTHALALDPQSSIGENNLGVVRADQSKLAEAIEHYQRALQIKPEYAQAYNNWGHALARQGKLTEAVERYRQALKIKPDYAKAVSNLGTVLAQQGKLAEASDHLRQALQIMPDNADAHYNLGIALVRQGKPAEASEHFREALRINPDDADAHYNWGTALAQQGKLAEAAQHYQRALQINPSSLLNALPSVGAGKEETAPSSKGKRAE